MFQLSSQIFPFPVEETFLKNKTKKPQPYFISLLPILKISGNFTYLFLLLKSQA